jgi:hypothetical protein
MSNENNAIQRDASGVSGHLQINGLGNQTGHAKPRKPSSFSNFMKPEHKRMARMLGYSLTLGTADAWAAFIFVASARLSMAERGALAFCALNSLDPDDAELTAAAAIGEAGAPLPTFLGGMEEARFWASCASRSERKAYALACFEAMSATDQAAFHRHISEMEVAA